MTKLSVDSIIFDLDGTLWDSTATCAIAWQSVINQLDFINVKISQTDLKQISGTQHDLIFPTLFPTLTKQELNQITDLCSQSELEYIKQYGGQLFDNAEEALTDLSQKIPLFIVSNCQNGYIEAFLNYHNLESFFQDYECSGRTRKSKAVNIQSVVERNKLKAPIYIGDTNGDRQAAFENNIPFIYAAYGFGSVESFDEKVSSLNEIKQIITITTSDSFQ